MESGSILIVDDDPVVRDVLADIFSRSGGHTAESVSSGYEGIKKLSERDYDVVFTDLTMPGMTGIDFMRQIKKFRPLLPVVVITGYSTMENAVNAMREGARDFITKPFNVRTVTSVAERVIGENRLFKKVAGNNPCPPPSTTSTTTGRFTDRSWRWPRAFLWRRRSHSASSRTGRSRSSGPSA